MQTGHSMSDAETTLPTTMKAAAINRFGGAEEISFRDLPVPRIDPDEILVHVEAAGIGAWDPMERDGLFAGMTKTKPRFPYVLGSDGAGTVVAVGSKVRKFRIGDHVYAMSFMSPKGGFYAEYAAVKADSASHVPAKLTIEQASVMPVDAITALRGVDDTLKLKPGESILIFGASGGIGHLAVQIAKRMGARVLAVASGQDGIALAKRLGADAAVDGKADDVAAAAREFAPSGIDAALITAGGRGLEHILAALRDGGRVAYPNGVQPVPRARQGITVQAYDGMPDSAAIEKLNHLIETGPFDVHVDRIFPLNEAAEGQRAVGKHHLGKLALRPTA